MSLIFKKAPSPNFDERPEGATIKYIILHYTGLKTAEEALRVMCDPEKKVSAHYQIDTDGTIWQLVADERRAWHAGRSAWRDDAELNATSIGIELVNPGHQFGYQNFEAPQIEFCIRLVRELMMRYNIPSEHVLGHSDIAPLRKEDPGEKFPWALLAQNGIGLWGDYSDFDDGSSGVEMGWEQVRHCLRAIGFACESEGLYDMTLRRYILAFQRHWVQHNLSGLMDTETTEALRYYSALASGALVEAA